MGLRRCYKIKEKGRRMFPVKLPRFLGQNRFLLEKLTNFKKKITSIGPTVQKLCNFFVLALFSYLDGNIA